MKQYTPQKNGKSWLFLLIAVFMAASCVALSLLGGFQNTVPDASVPSVSPSFALPTSEPEPEPIVTELRFSATGDDLIHDGLYLQAKARGGDTYDFTALYENVAAFYRQFDINWINQETLLSDEIPPSSYPRFCSPGDLGRHLYDLGFRVFSTSNNHSYDQGAYGIESTLRYWSGMPADVISVGFYTDEQDLQNIRIQEIDGVRIAYLAYTEHTNGLPTPSGAAASVIYTSQEDVIRQQIESAREKADVVVVGVHWGTENSHIVNDAQRALGQKMADWGADIILGTHPHVVQNVEYLTSQTTGKTVPIVYSLGNFVSTQIQPDNLIGIVLTCTITKTVYPDDFSETHISDVQAVPMVMHYDAGFQNARVYLLSDYTQELAAAHGNGSMSLPYIRQVLTENISPDILQLEETEDAA